ncbi:DUF2497 domain-containing protein [Fulvimarina sp. 2208YS6-2-32]|uniref:DUF2497 domain-containing protein n=1 Tax=Fulvimarina uroteuthidis TaxID=3098149 RepID=A0ABU5I3Y0_9HYPH|nr:DUF2497 domain-containing protein [Fulvimarina sp. 2208YS6-2-32]MDY8109797.1 DUF2497 domain-containing protein [Fulvimarina sp. 2208YS6-2-32]
MDEILASIRRIIEGRDEPELAPLPARKSELKAVEALASAADPARAEGQAETVSHRAEAAVPSTGPALASLAEHAVSEAPALKPPLVDTAPIVAPEARSVPAGAEVPPARPLVPKAVNDEGTTPFAGSKTSAVEREVASQMEELATLSVARMRAASLEDAVRGFRRNGRGDERGIAPDEAPIERAANAFVDEFDETAFANELLANAGLLPEYHDQPASVAPAEAVKLRLAYPQSPAEEVEAETSLPFAIDAATLDRVETSADAADTHAIADEATEAPSPSLATAPEAATSPDAADMATQGMLVSLISGNAESKINSSFTELATVLRDEQRQRMDETVRDMLQPMLSDWLEDNLPLIVERLVREEIERVARGPRRA